MATLYFKIGADYENVIRLRDEIKKLESQLRSFGKSTPETQIRQTEERLATTRQEFVRLTTEAAKAGATLENDFKKKIYDASQTVNDLSEKIIAQRTVVREVQADVKRLGEAYRTALKTNPIGASGMKTEYNAARKVLDEERAALFGLTQQQANARLSVKKLRDEYNLFKDESGDVKDAIGDITDQMKNWVAGIAGGIGLKEFLGQMIQIRGEFENIETSLGVLLGGDKEKLTELMSEMKEYALISPLTTKDMASALQMMIGFGIQAEDAITYLKALGDISMGNTVHFNSLALAFSQMSAAGKLMGQDLNQMINAGFNPLQQISEKTGKSIGELKDEMSKGAISAQMVQQAFIDATSAGGKFYGMAAEGAKTINGQISMLQESVDNMFNDMGQASEGIILSSIQAITKLVENYDKVGAVIIGLVTAYGTYKAALLTLWALEQARNGTLLATIKNTKLATAAQNLFNKTVKAHPYALIASLAIGAAAAIYSLAKRTNEVSASQKALDEVSRNYNATVKSEQAEIDRLFDALRNAKEGTNEYQKAKDDILSKYGQYLNGLNSEIATLHDVEGAYKAVAAAARESARARAIESATSKAQEIYGETYTENASKLRRALIKQIGENKTSVILSQIRKDLQETGKVADTTKKKIGDALTGVADYGNSKAWITGLERNEKELRNAYKEIDDLFKQTETSTTKKTSTLLEDYNEAAKAYENAQKKLDEINANRGKYSAKQYEDAVTALKTAKSNFEKLGGETQTDKQRQSAATKAENEHKKEAEKRKRAQEELDKDLLSLQQKNQDDEIALMRDGTEKKLAEIDNDYKKRIAEIERQEAEFKEKNKEAGLQGLGADGLTKKQQNALQEAADNAAKERERQTQEVYLAEAQAMRDYLKEYGTFQQQKLAIAEEYAEKIKNAQSEGERLSLEKEREQAVANVNLSAIKQDVDWAGVFSRFGTMFQDEIEHNLDALMDIMKSDEFKAMRPTDQAQIVEAVDSLRAQVTGDLKDVDFKKIGEFTVEFQNAQRKMIAAQAAEAAAYDNLKKAQADYEQALRNGTAEEQAAAKQRLDMAQTTADSMSAAYKGAVGEFNATGNNLKDATDNAVDAINSISSAISQIKSGSLSGAFEGVKNLSGTLGKSLSNMSGLLGKAGNALSKFSSTLGGATGEIVGAVLGLLDLLKDGFGSIFADLSDLMFGAVNGILDDILSGGIITKPAKSLVDGLGGILDTVTFGGFSSWGNNAAETKETIDRLTTRNDALIDSLDRLNDTMQDVSGAAESVAAAEQAKKYQEEINENYRDIAAARAHYQGKHHSWSKYFNDWLEKVGLFDGLDSVVGNKAASLLGIDDKDLETWRKMNDIAGFEIKSRTDFLSITPEQMAEMLADVDIRELIESIGKGGYGAKMLAALEDYADQAGKIEEIDNSLRETLTQISFDSLYDNFIDTLMDMDASAEDFADNMSEYFMRAVLSDKVGEMFKTRLNEWYNAFALAMKDGNLDDYELKNLRDDYENIVKDAMAERDDLANAIGYTSSDNEQQSASKKGYATASQDSIDELSGRTTAMYESNLRIETAEQQQTVAITELRGSISALTAQASGMYNIADETRTILANSYLELQQIRENTGEIIKPIKQMQADIAEVKRNTARL